MAFDRKGLPDPIAYYESEGLSLTERGKWRTTACSFHGSSDSMRINSETGAFVCMAGCGAKGGDVLAHHMIAHGLEFIDAAKALGAWVEDGQPVRKHNPSPISPRAALEVLGFESLVVAVAAGNLAHGLTLTDADRQRVATAANRIGRLREIFR